MRGCGQHEELSRSALHSCEAAEGVLLRLRVDAQLVPLDEVDQDLAFHECFACDVPICLELFTQCVALRSRFF